MEERPPEIDAVVRGSSQIPYRVKITVTPRENEGARIKGDCSCPVGAYYKHVAAVLIESRVRHPDLQVSKQAQLFSVKPALQALSKDSLPAHIMHWIAALERSQASDSEDYPPDAQNRLLYIFSLPE